MPLLKQQDKITVPYKVYGESNIEPAALHQFYEAMKLENTVAGALMPDAHFGYSLPIGGVIATEGIISPSFVGYDIGCGMCAIPLPYKRHELEPHRKAIFDSIYRSVPSGLGGKNQTKTLEKWDYEDIPRSEFLDNIMSNGGMADLASLGSGK